MQSEHSGLCPDYEQSCSINNPINIYFNPISIGFMNTSVSCVGFFKPCFCDELSKRFI